MIKRFPSTTYLPVAVKLCTILSNLTIEFSRKLCSLISLFNSGANIQAKENERLFYMLD